MILPHQLHADNGPQTVSSVDAGVRLPWISFKVGCFSTKDFLLSLAIWYNNHQVSFPAHGSVQVSESEEEDAKEPKYLWSSTRLRIYPLIVFMIMLSVASLIIHNSYTLFQNLTGGSRLTPLMEVGPTQRELTIYRPSPYTSHLVLNFSFSFGLDQNGAVVVDLQNIIPTTPLSVKQPLSRP